MPDRNSPTGRAASPASPGNFRQRYDGVEKHRDALLSRLNRLEAAAQKHPAHKRALTLLNETFRKSKLAQRMAVLQAAAWLIQILERLTLSV